MRFTFKFGKLNTINFESTVLNESFDMNDSVSNLLKQGLAAKVQTQKHIEQNIF